MIGSACRCTILHVPSSGRRTLVTRSAPETISSVADLRLEPLDLHEIGQVRRHRHRECLEAGSAAVSVVRRGTLHRLFSATCGHPIATGPNGLASLASSRWEYNSFAGSGSPRKNSSKARWYRSTNSFRSGAAIRSTAISSPLLPEFCCRSSPTLNAARPQRIRPGPGGDTSLVCASVAPPETQSQGRDSRKAALIRPTWLYVCGKLPLWTRVSGRMSSL